MKKLWMVLFVVLMPKILLAKEVPVSKVLNAACVAIATASGSSDKIVECKDDENLPFYEKELNKNYKLLLSNLTGQAKLFILRERQKWGADVNQACIKDNECRLRMTFEQNKKIEDVLYSLGFNQVTGD